MSSEVAQPPDICSPRATAAVAFATALVPVALDVVLRGPLRAIHYLAGDAYYYLLVGRNIWEKGRISYDGELPTNGFHPLWQAAVALFYPAFGLAGNHAPEAAALAAWFATLLLTALACAAIAWVAALECRRIGWALAALPAGVYTALAWRAAGAQSTLWMQANGMESALSLSVFAAVLALLTRGTETLPRAAAFGVVLATLVLSRLDLVFFPVAFGLAALPRALRDRGAFRSLATTTAMVAAIVGCYLALSHAYAGSALPVSGRSKTTFPALNGNTLGGTINYLFGIGEAAPDFRKRIAQMAIPFLWAALWIFIYTLRLRRSAPSTWQHALLVCHLGVLLRHGHDLLFVHAIHTDYWYYPVSQVVVSLGALELAEAVSRQRGFLPSRRTFGVGLAIVAAAQAGLFAVTIGREPSKFPYAASLWQHRESIAKDLGDPPPHVLEMEDGILGFVLRLPALSGTGLSLDAEASEALDENRLLALAWGRGYRALAITPRYLNFASLDPAMPPEQATMLLQARYSWLRKEKNFTFALRYLSPDRSVALFDLVPVE